MYELYANEQTSQLSEVTENAGQTPIQGQWTHQASEGLVAMLLVYFAAPNRIEALPGLTRSFTYN